MSTTVTKALLSLSMVLVATSYTLAEEPMEIAMGTPEIDAEMDELFGTSSLESVVVSEFEVVDLTSDSLTLPLVEETLADAEVLSRDEQFSLSLTENGIEYSLSSAISTPTIELRSIKGDVIVSVKHSDTDIVGAFDTQELLAGYYIVRVVDSNGDSQREAYAVAVN